MTKHIEYRKFDEMGNLRAERVGTTQYTLRGGDGRAEGQRVPAHGG